MAFEELCPERIDLIHKNYRKLCNLLVDIDEWGQSAVIHMLTRYARSQFLDPNKAVWKNLFWPSAEAIELKVSDVESNVGQISFYKTFVVTQNTFKVRAQINGGDISSRSDWTILFYLSFWLVTIHRVFQKRIKHDQIESKSYYLTRTESFLCC